jgi:putative heme utilization carrier protein HutX
LSTSNSATKVTEYFVANPRAMTMVAARELGISEAQVMRNLPSDKVTELSANHFRDMMDRLAEYEKVHVIVSNGATTIESFGKFGNFSTFGPFFNVQSKTLDMHIRQDEIDSVFAVEKPGHLDGVVTLSIQFYDRTGASAFKVFLTFGEKVPSDACRLWWNGFRDEFTIGEDS